NRFARIREVLDTARLFTLADMTRLQQDEACLPARALVPLLRSVQPATDAARRARERPLAWDQLLSRDSVAAALYGVVAQGLPRAPRGGRSAPRPAAATAGPSTARRTS